MIKVEFRKHMGDDLDVVNCARVSFDKESRWESKLVYEFYGENDYVEREWEKVLSERDVRLINYLAREGHYAPFGHCFASFRITAPIFVARQLVKHKYLRMSEISRRYVTNEPEIYDPEMWRKAAENKKQGSSNEPIDLRVYHAFDGDLVYEHESLLDDYNLREFFYEHMDRGIALYNSLIKVGVCPEQARMVLPLNIMTTWIWSGSMDAFFNMYALRSKEDTQYETRLVANQIGEHMERLFPVSWGALKAHA